VSEYAADGRPRDTLKETEQEQEQETARFVAFDPAVVPEEFRGMFHSLTEEEFRVDLSSTQIREATKLELAESKKARL
jgi:hypothetical protein